ncbi:MAG: fumarylacetoacetate hydrolase family protein [Solirubrobacteraceae bacterium]|nr:fumarylacetoacetate hydrolase family protein [Solirubrobacteraceae bacterium]
MQLGIARGQIVRWSDDDDGWVVAGREVPKDLIDLLEGELGAEPGRTTEAPGGLPFSPRSLRGVMVVESHYVAGARTMVRHFMPAPVNAFVRLYEAVTRRTFPALKPPPRFYEAPAFYLGSHMSMAADGDIVDFPAATDYRDFELELGAIVTRPWDSRRDGPPSAADVIGAFTVINDFSARDLQWRDERRGAFSGVVKAKSFATGMGSTVVTADELLPRWNRVAGRVYVNGDLWCEGSTAGGRFSLDEIVAEIAADERLVPGEVISLGTLAGCCGLELDRFLEPGDRVRLELEGVGSLTNTVGVR